MKKATLMLFATILLASCNGKTVYSKVDEFPDQNRWMKSDIKVFEFEIAQEATPYGIELLFNHGYGYQFAQVPIIVEITYPDGSISSEMVDLDIKDASGSDLGDCAGDYCDLSQEIPTPKPLVPGKYKLRLMHNFKGEFLPNVLGLGIRVSQHND